MLYCAALYIEGKIYAGQYNSQVILLRTLLYTFTDSIDRRIVTCVVRVPKLKRQ